jgi:xylan 1,4-beta-xylosidase
VEALAARHDDGRTGILVWNVTLDQGKIGGDPLLDRRVLVRVAGPARVRYTVRHYRIDAGHSNIVPAWEGMRGRASWPSGGQRVALREQNRLEELAPASEAVAGADGLVELSFDLPMPGVSCLELIPS